MTDEVIAAVSRDGALRARVAFTSELVTEALVRHLPSELGAIALGRALTAVAIVPASIKDCDRLSVQWLGRGPLGGVMAEIREPGHLRGSLRAPGARVEGSFSGARGVGYGLLPQGIVSVMRQIPGQGFGQSQVPMVSGEIDEDLEEWFTRSEQTPTRLRTGVALKDHGLSAESAVVLVQALPGTDPESVPRLPADAALLGAAGPEDLLHRALAGIDWQVLERRSLVFACTCSQERIAAGLALLGNGELRSMIEEDHGAKIRCDFCATHYTFSASDLEALISA